MSENPICRICGLPVVLRDTEIGPVLVHLSDEVEANHEAILDDGSYLPGLNRD